MTHATATAKYPTTLLAITDVGQWSNKETNSLASTITSGATSIVLTSATTGMPSSGVITIENERILYTSKDDSTKTLTVPASPSGRGWDGSTAAAHSIGAIVRMNVVALHYNQILADLIAVQTKIGTGNLTSGSVLFASPTGTIAQDNANLFWDDTNNRLGIGTNSPTSKAHLVGTGASNLFLVGLQTTNGITGDEVGIGFGSSAAIGRFKAAMYFKSVSSELGDIVWAIRNTPDGTLVSSADELMRLTRVGQLQLPTQGSTGGLLIGADVLLYRGGSNVLAITDDRVDINMAAAASLVFGTFQTGDAVNRFQFTAGGTISWGPGNSAVDTSLYRRGASDLATDDTFTIIPPGNITGLRMFIATGDVNETWRVRRDGLIEWGAGGASAPDTNLYRAAANELKTDDSFQATGSITAALGATPQVSIGGGSIPTISLGTSADVNLTRGGPNDARLDSELNVIRSAPGDRAFGTNHGLANPLFTIQVNGTMNWGDGTNLVDVQLARGAANRLDLVSGDSFNIVQGTLFFAADTPILRTDARRIMLAAKNAAPTDGNMENESIVFYLNEGGNELKVRAKYSDGTLKTGTVALV